MSRADVDTRKRPWLIEGLELCERLAEISEDLDWPVHVFYREADLSTIQAQLTRELTELERGLQRG